MAREISLSGGDISVIKALGLSGSAVSGKSLLGRIGEMEEAELIDTLGGLMMFDYILSDVEPLRRIDDVERAVFKINPACTKELREALSPQPQKAAPRRQRRG